MKVVLFAIAFSLLGAMCGILWRGSWDNATNDPRLNFESKQQTEFTDEIALEFAQLRLELLTELNKGFKDQAKARQLNCAQSPDPNTELTLQAEISKTKQAVSAGASEPSSAYLTAITYVEQELSSGVWSEQERADISSMLGHMGNQERDEVMRSIIRSVNDGSLRVEVTGPLFL